MASNLFSELIVKGIKSGQMPARNEESRKWFREKARSSFLQFDPKQGRNRGVQLNEAKFIRTLEADRMKTRFTIGSMYMYHYQPKHRATLEYYDSFPMVFPFSKTENGFLGLNLHYLPYTLRGTLLDALYNNLNNKRYDESTKLKISYAILKDVAKYPQAAPCIKHYLTAQVRSKFIQIHVTEWDIAAMLPLHAFEKASAQKVWKDSRAQIIAASRR